MTEQAGSGDPVYTLSRLCASAMEVAEAARANLAVLLRGTRTLAATISRGSPAVAAETELRLRGFRQGVDDRWACTRARHVLTGRGGYTTQVQAESQLSWRIPSRLL